MTCEPATCPARPFCGCIPSDSHQPEHTPDDIARALQLNAFRAWNAANQRARDEYEAHPITSHALLCDCGFKVCHIDCPEEI